MDTTLAEEYTLEEFRDLVIDSLNYIHIPQSEIYILGLYLQDNGKLGTTTTNITGDDSSVSDISSFTIYQLNLQGILNYFHDYNCSVAHLAIKQGMQMGHTYINTPIRIFYPSDELFNFCKTAENDSFSEFENMLKNMAIVEELYIATL